MGSAMKLEQGRITSGVWEGILTGGDAATSVEAVHDGRALDGIELRPVTGQAGQFAVRVPIPAWALSDGIQTILVRSGGETLATITLAAGEMLDPDIRAELTLLRAELDLLKRAFQRHVREG